MVWPIKAILPLTVLRFLLAHFSSSYSYLHHPLLDLHAMLEVALFVHFKIKAHTLTNSQPAAAASYLYPEIDIQQTMAPLDHLNQCLRHLDHALREHSPSASPAELRARKQYELAGWFTDASQGSHNARAAFEQIHRHHLSTWLAWAFLDAPLDEQLEEELAPLVDAIEVFCRSPLQSGKHVSASIVPLRLNIDSLRAQHRPILHYFVTHFSANLAGWAIFTSRGFKRRVKNGQTYYFRERRIKKKGRKKKPLVFVSGIGIGLVSYERLVSALMCDDRDILVFDLPEISLRWTPFKQHAHAPPLQTVETISSLIRGAHNGHLGAHCVAHSMGCVIVQWLLRLGGGGVGKGNVVVSSLTFVDPVCFLLICPNVAANFCYRWPKTYLDILVSYFVAREVGVNNSLHRHFQWKLNNLDPKLLPKNSVVILSEWDAFVPSELVQAHLRFERPDVKVAMLKRHFHSQFSVVPESFNLVAELSRSVDK